MMNTTEYYVITLHLFRKVNKMCMNVHDACKADLDVSLAEPAN